MDYNRFLIVLCFILGTATGLLHGTRNVNHNYHGKSNSQLGMFEAISSTIQRHPFMVAIRWLGEFWCVGSIIGDEWVITSAVCMESLTVKTVTVLAASNDASTGDIYSVSAIIRHPDFNATSYDYPYALIKINQTFVWKTKVGQIKLPTEDLTNTTRILVSSWGKASSNAATKTVQQGGMKWMPKGFCSSSFANMSVEWTDRMACTYNQNRTTLCAEDYGAPIVLKGHLYGVFVMMYMNANVCSTSAGPSMLADVFQVVDWITETIANNTIF